MKSKMFFNKFEVLEFVNSLASELDVNGSAGIGGWGLKLEDGRSFYEPNFNYWVERMAIELNLPFDKDMSRKYGSQFCIYFKDVIEEPVKVEEIEIVGDVVCIEDTVEDVILSDISIEEAKKLKTKKALDSYAREYGYELDARKSLKNMLIQLEKLITE